MAGSDIMMCTFRYFNSTNDRFVCVDSFANSNSKPIPDLNDNIIDIETKTEYDGRNNWATLTAVFEKPLSSDGNSQEDFEILNGAYFDAIWAHGTVVGGSV